LQDYQTFEIEKPKDISGLSGGVELEYIRWGDNIKVVRKKGA